MSKISLLDCTLRDGGYINDWKFGETTITSIFQKLLVANIDIIEVGFLTNLSHESGCSLYSDILELESIIPENKGTSQIAAMIALGEHEMDPNDLCNANDSNVDIIRLTFHNYEDEIQRAIKFATCLMNKGYRVCMQPVGSTAYTDQELLNIIVRMNQLNPYAFYLVDTLGTLYKQDLLRFLYLIDNNLRPEICIGFHSHNNVQMSFANAQEIIEFPSDRNFIVDSSVYGMGRGAGNLCTEILAEFINKTVILKYDIDPLLEIIDESLMPIFAQNPWGYSAAYFLSAIKKCHPNYATYLLSRQTLQVRDIGMILSQLPLNERAVFNKKLIDQLYLARQENEIDDLTVRNELKEDIRDKSILILGMGKSIAREKATIEKFIEENKPFVFSVNYASNLRVNKVFISNQRRYSTINLIDYSNVLFTSNVKSKPEFVATLNYSSLLNDNELIYDNAGLMLMELLRQLGVKKICLAGFDGFIHNQTENYYETTQMGVMEQEQLDKINSAIEFQLKKFRNTIELEFITTTNYNL